MAITGKFQADFASFLDAVRQAEVKLVDLGEGAAGVGARLNRMVDNFSGRKVIQEATLMATALEQAGGTSKLTTAELERMGAKAAEATEKFKKLGYEVPPGIQRISDLARGAAEETLRLNDASKQTAGGMSDLLSSASKLAGAFGLAFGAGQIVSGVVNFGKAIFANADALEKMHDKTGISIEGLQRLQIAGDDAGNTLEDITGAVNKMQKTLGQGNEGALAAIDRLGLKFEDLKRLSPDQQFIAIGDAIRKIDDPMQQVAIGAEIFGKSFAEVLPTIKRGFEDIKDSAIVTSTEAIDAIDKLGDAMKRMGRSSKAAASEVAGNLILGKGTGTGFEQLSDDLADIQDQLKGMGAEAERVAPKLYFKQPLADLQNLGFAVEKVSEPLRDMQERMKESADAAKKWASEQKALNDAAQKLVDTLSGGGAIQQAGLYLNAIEKIGGVTTLTQKAQESLNGVLDAAIEAYKALGLSAPDALLKTWAATVKLLSVGNLKDLPGQIQFPPLPPTAFIPMFATLPTALKSSIHSNRATFADAFTDALGDVPDLLARALTGGGGLSGALKAIGSDLGSKIGGHIKDSIVNSFKDSSQVLGGFTKLFANALPAIGSLLGPAIEGISALFGKLFNNPEKQINPLREAFVQAAGGLDALNQHAHAAGVTLDALLNAKNAEQYKAAVDDLTKAFADFDQKIAGLKGEIETLQKSTVVDFDKMAAIAQKYGVGLEGLGPKFQAAQIGATAQGIINDFDTLSRGLGDVDEALTVLRKPINDLVNDSIKFGTAIPQNFRPWVDQLQKTHQLTDENGDELTDLSKIKFGDPIATEFEKVTSKIGELTKKLDDLITALGNIKPVTIDVGYNYQPFNPPDVGGGYNTGVEPIRAAMGFEGRVTQPTLFLAGEAGPENVSIGQGGGDSSAGMLNELRALRQDLQNFPRQIRDAIRLAA